LAGFQSTASLPSRVFQILLKLENGRIELMEPTRDDSPIKKFLEKKERGCTTWRLPQTISKRNTREWKGVDPVPRKNPQRL
jgi:hypothetical protein